MIIFPSHDDKAGYPEYSGKWFLLLKNLKIITLQIDKLRYSIQVFVQYKEIAKERFQTNQSDA